MAHLVDCEQTWKNTTESTTSVMQDCLKQKSIINNLKWYDAYVSFKPKLKCKTSRPDFKTKKGSPSSHPWSSWHGSCAPSFAFLTSQPWWPIHSDSTDVGTCQLPNHKRPWQKCWMNYLNKSKVHLSSCWSYAWPQAIMKLGGRNHVCREPHCPCKEKVEWNDIPWSACTWARTS